MIAPIEVWDASTTDCPVEAGVNRTSILGECLVSLDAEVGRDAVGWESIATIEERQAIVGDAKAEHRIEAGLVEATAASGATAVWIIEHQLRIGIVDASRVGRGLHGENCFLAVIEFAVESI